MIRVIAGKHKGRIISKNLNNNKVRPTKTKIREALFSILTSGRFLKDDGSVLQNADIVELFCGTASLSIEALSRGAKSITLIDQDQSVLDAARESLMNFDELESADIIRADATRLPRARKQCDIAFIDAPYKGNFTNKAIESLNIQGWLKSGSILVIESDKYEEIIQEDFELVTTRNYGISKVTILEKI